MKASYSSFVRMAFGVWLLVFFLQSALAVKRLEFLAEQFGFLPPAVIQVMTMAGFLAALSFATGKAVRISSVVLLLSLHALLFAIPRFRTVVFPHISIVLVIFALYYQAGILSERKVWYLPLFLGIYAGFSVSGISKLFFGLWNNGEMVRGQCDLSLAATLGICENLPSARLALIVAVIEVASFPLVLLSRTRPLIWAVSTLLHFLIIFFVPQFSTRTGFFLVQLFLFDPAWMSSPPYAQRQTN